MFPNTMLYRTKYFLGHGFNGFKILFGSMFFSKYNKQADRPKLEISLWCAKTGHPRFQNR